MERGARKNTACACLRWCYQYQTQAPLPPMQIKCQYFPGISQAFNTKSALLVSSFLDWASARFSSPTYRYTLLVPIPSHKGRSNESSLFLLWAFRELCLTQLPQSKMMPFSYSSSTDDFHTPQHSTALAFHRDQIVILALLSWGYLKWWLRQLFGLLEVSALTSNQQSHCK